MKIAILGAGPAGLYSGLLIKKANPSHAITIIERNAADVTYGWGVVFSDRTLASFQRADYKTYEQITGHFVIWDDIDVYYRGEKISCAGHVIASISRKRLLNILQSRCRELGIDLRFGHEINDLAELEGFDLLIAADGINSIVRKNYASQFKPNIELGRARYIWLGADKVLDAFTFIFCENEHGLFQVHSYPFSGTSSTFIVECDEASWLKAAQESQTYFETIKRYLGLDPMQFTFQLLTRSGRITYDDLRLRDSRFVDAVDRWAMQKANSLLTYHHPQAIFAPPPVFTPVRLRNLMLSNRLVLSPRLSYPAQDGMPGAGHAEQMSNDTLAGAALVVTEPIAISAEGRITPESAGLYKASHVEAWIRIVESIHTRTAAKLALLLNHAGRRGSTRPRAQGLDRPLSHSNWPLLSSC